jgi:hypothetical protein
LLAALILHAAGLALHAGVDLGWVDNDGTPSGWLGARNATFILTLNISSSEATTGLDYFLVSNDGFVGGTSYFTMTNRDITGTSYNDLYFTDAQVEAPPGNILNPRTDSDLGGILNNVNNANVPGTYLVSKYTFLVANNTPFGTYTIQTTSNAGTGWIGEGPDFPESEFSHHASYSITVAAPQWNRDTGGSWATTTNWSDNIVPNVATGTANFLNRITIPSTVSMDGAKALNTLNVDSPVSYTISRGSGGTLTMGGTSPSINILSGSHTISTFVTFSSIGAVNVSSNASVVLSGTFTWSVNGTINVGTGASATLSGAHTIAAGRTLTRAGAGTLTISGTQTPGLGAVLNLTGGTTNINSTNGVPATATVIASTNLSMNISGSASVKLGADQTLKALTLSSVAEIGAQGLDLNSPATAGAFRSVRVYATDLAAAKSALWSAVVNAAANPGDGIVDSGVAAHLNSRLGIAIVPDLHGDQHVLLRPTIIGDLNFDGTVTIADFIDLASNFNAVGITWQEGDLNADGTVTIADFIDLASNFNATYAGEVFPISPEDAATLAQFAASHVPEPGLIGLTGVVILMLSRRRPMVGRTFLPAMRNRS